jgi:endonuclease YncB( thermonuclease family)
MVKRLRITRKTPWWLVGIIILLTVAQQTGWLKPAEQKLIELQPGQYQVTQIFDGDTIEVDMNGVKEKVRLIGVDTPETHDPRKQVQCFGKAATAYTTQLIGNQPVRLAADPENSNRDRYQRLLRYVYLTDGSLLQAQIIKGGYGFAYTSFPFTKSEEFKSLENSARESNRGLWGQCNPTTNEFGGYTSNDEMP